MNKKQLTEQDLQAAKNLKAIWVERKSALGLTQEVAAERLGFGTQGAVSHYLNAQMPLNLEAVLKFSGLLQVPPEAIRPDMADIFQCVRQYTPSAEISPPKPLPPPLSEQQKKLIELVDDLPESDTEQIIRDMEQKRDFYRRKVEELLRKKNKPA
ncbi:TPA: helix-turn-helix domain-containing protein [Salmonella enterica subsp. diarizonae serovar 61:r:z53]